MMHCTYNVKRIIKKCNGRTWGICGLGYLAQYVDQWLAVVNLVMNLCVP